MGKKLSAEGSVPPEAMSPLLQWTQFDENFF